MAVFNNTVFAAMDFPVSKKRIFKLINFWDFPSEVDIIGTEKCESLLINTQ
jgi:hypothetical protein